MEATIIMGVMLVLMMLRVPVAFAMALSAVVALMVGDIPLTLVPQRMFNSLDSFPLLAIPLFVFVGEAMNTGGITTRIFNFAREYVKHITGSLGHVNVISNIIVAGMSGSAVADASAIGVVEIKAMEEDGFDRDWSAALTAASSTIGPIIPPSIPFVIYAIITETSIGRLFLGGLIPGLMMGISLMILVYIMSKQRGYKVEPKATWGERLDATWKAIPSLLTPVIMFSGIVFGIVTPTEGAGIAAAYAIFLGFVIHREMDLPGLYHILLRTVHCTAVIMLIICSSSAITWVVQTSGLPDQVAAWLLAFSDSKVVLLIFINVVLLIMGCLLESNSIIMIMVPVLMPLIHALGVDPVHFGVFFILNVMIGLITPPVGMCLYVICNIADVPFEKLSRAIVPFIIPLVIVLFLITFIPDLVLWLPNHVMGLAK
ncbi:MAG TPA: TRAP transporter large permease [Negativicutes bacterium]|nr:TRAP transporter large permease [Negativicutes bacterium]